jgi:hypothetical protein
VGKEMSNYPIEVLDSEYDNGTMPKNVKDLASEVVGHKIVKVEFPDAYKHESFWGDGSVLKLTLDNGKEVFLEGTSDCCAYTSLETFIFNVEKIDHVITGVGTTDGYSTWHIYADMGDVLTLSVGWSSGNPFYYAYGFSLNVKESQ